MSDTPHYEEALKRLELFRNEKPGWDGYGGRPASTEICADVTAFLKTALVLGLEEPDLAMGNDGSVAVVWNRKGWYVAADFSGDGHYIFLAFDPDRVMRCQGDSEACALPQELKQCIQQTIQET